MKARGLAIFDRSVATVTAGGTYYTAPTFRVELAEELACAALVHWHRAAQAAGAIVVHGNVRLLFRAALDGTAEARAAAVREIDRVVALLESNAHDYRSTTVDDFGHLRHQDELSRASPYLALAKMLLGMAHAEAVAA